MWGAAGAVGGESVSAKFRVVLVPAENRDFKLPVPSFFKVESNLQVATAGKFGSGACQSGWFWERAIMACDMFFASQSRHCDSA